MRNLWLKTKFFFYLEWLRDSVSLLLGGHWRAIIFCTFRGFAMQGSSPSILCESQGGSVWNLQKKKKNQTQNAGNCSPEACFLLIRQLFKKKSQFQSQCFSKWIVFINLVNWLSSRWVMNAEIHLFYWLIFPHSTSIDDNNHGKSSHFPQPFQNNDFCSPRNFWSSSNHMDCCPHSSTYNHWVSPNVWWDNKW